MNVLQLVNTPRPFFDKQVEALERQGIDCTTITVPGTHDTEQTRSPADYLRYYPSVLDAATDYDIVHAHYGLMGPFALAQPTRPVVLTLWGSDLMDGDSFVPRLSRLSARFSDEVILPSTKMSPFLDTSHEILPWGVDTELFRPIGRERARERLGWDRDETVFLFPYPADRPVKNYQLAERVVDRLDADATLRTMVDVPYETVPYYMNASDAVLVTSRRESGPMVVKEAAACGVPVVSTDVGFVADVLDGVDNGYVCDGETELVAALSDVLGSDRTSGERAQIAGLEETGEKLVSVYRDALAGR